MKPTSFNWTPVVLAALAILPAAHAQQGPPPGGGGGGHHPHPHSALVEALDTDRDHTISAEEIKNAAAALAKLDTDGDGKLSKEELRPKPPKDAPDGGKGPRGDKGPPPSDDDSGSTKGDRPKPPADPLLTALDTDGDGTLSAAEIAAAPTSLLTLDKDKDGALSEKEFRPEPPKGERPQHQ